MTIDTTIARIRAYVTQQGIAKSRLAAMAGVSEFATRGLFEADWNPTAETIRALERVIPSHFVSSRPLPDAVDDAASARSGR